MFWNCTDIMGMSDLGSDPVTYEHAHFSANCFTNRSKSIRIFPGKGRAGKVQITPYLDSQIAEVFL